MRKILKSLPVIAILGIPGAGHAGLLYVTPYNGVNGQILDTDTNTVVGTIATTSPVETGIAVGSTIRTIGTFNTGAGNEYDLSGNVINAGVYANPGLSTVRDGTTDGTYNYAFNYYDNTVYRMNADWTAPVALFTTANRGSGITYDSQTNTLWTTESQTASGTPNGFVRQYTLDGTLLSEFDKGSYDAYGIAWDSTDNTLWLSEYGTSLLHQYTTDGTALTTTDFGGAAVYNGSGLEFAEVPAVTNPVPAPPAGALFTLGLAAFAARRRRSA